MNLSPRGRNIGYRPKKVAKVAGDFDEMDNIVTNMVGVASQMEDSTESAINRIEAMRQETLNKAEK